MQLFPSATLLPRSVLYLNELFIILQSLHYFLTDWFKQNLPHLNDPLQHNWKLTVLNKIGDSLNEPSDLGNLSARYHCPTTIAVQLFPGNTHTYTNIHIITVFAGTRVHHVGVANFDSNQFKPVIILCTQEYTGSCGVIFFLNIIHLLHTLYTKIWCFILSSSFLRL